MGLFESDDMDFVSKQLEIYTEIAQERQDMLDKLDGVDTPEAEQQRSQLLGELQQAKLSILQTREAAERAGRDLDDFSYDLDLFSD